MSRIRVKLKDGRIGTIDDSEFDPQTMAQLETPTTNAPTQQPQQGVLSQLWQGIKQPFEETGKNIASAVITIPQSLLAAGVGKFNPQLGAKIATPDIFNTQQTAADVSANPVESLLRQGKASAGVAAWGVPFGGELKLSQLLMRGALAGELAGISEGKPGIGAAVTGAAGAGVGGKVLAPILKRAFEPVAAAVAPKLEAAIPKISMPVKQFLAQFIVPTKLGKSLNFQSVGKEMIDQGLGTKPMEELAQVANQVTGDSGLISKFTREVVGNIEKEVPLGESIKSAQNVLEKSLIEEKVKKRILTQISTHFPTGKKIGFMNPLDAWDHARELEKMGHQWLNTSTYLTGNINNESIGKAYMAAADEILNGIEQAAKESGLARGGEAGVINLLKTPQLIAQASEITPRLGEQLSKASTIADLRAMQAPFVKLSRMIDLTQQAALSQTTRLGEQIGKVGGIAARGAISPLWALGSAGSEAGKTLLSSPGFNVGGAQMLEKAGGKLSGVTSKIGGAGKGVARTGFSNLDQLLGGSLAAGAAPVGAQVGARWPGASQQATLMAGPPTTAETTAPTTTTPETAQTQRTITPEQMQQVLLSPDISSKTKDRIKAAYDVQESYLKTQKTGGGTAAERLNTNNALSGLKALDVIESEINKNPNIAIQAAVPGSPGARIFATARKEASDILTRLRTGAALNKDEMKFYVTQLPQPFDSAETIKYKIKLFREIYNRIIQSGGAQTALTATTETQAEE